MNRILLFTFICIISAKVGAQSTSFTAEGLAERMLNLDGKTITFQNVLRKHKGKMIVINMWDSSNKHCIEAMPKIKALHKNFKKDVVFISISMDKNPEAWKRGMDEYNIKGEHYFATKGMKGSLGKSITLSWVPRYMVINKKGEIALYKAVHANDERITTILKDNI